MPFDGGDGIHYRKMQHQYILSSDEAIQNNGARKQDRYDLYTVEGYTITATQPTATAADNHSHTPQFHLLLPTAKRIN